jgi:hypothetical protein
MHPIQIDVASWKRKSASLIKAKNGVRQAKPERRTLTDRRGRCRGMRGTIHSLACLWIDLDWPWQTAHIYFGLFRPKE